MAKKYLLLSLAVVFLVGGTEAITFNNAYIQNVQSGECITADKDAPLAPLLTSRCNCGSYQFWKNEDGEHVVNELAFYGYMDELYGKRDNGATVGLYGLSGSAWQKWRIREDNAGNTAFVVQTTGKCLRQSPSGSVDQWDCNDSDLSQKWKIVSNPCGKLNRVPSGRFQLQNTKTGKCAVILGNSDAWWAKVVTGECSCQNSYHYWKLNKMMLVSEGRSKQCFANWESRGHPGVTQCICGDDAIHRWRFAPLDDEGNFNLITVIDGRCVETDGGGEGNQLGYRTCDRSDDSQKWRFHDACVPDPPTTQKPTAPPTLAPTQPPVTLPPRPINVIPEYLIIFFRDGRMNWLTLTRYLLLVGGHWDPLYLRWVTRDNQEIKLNSELWNIYFGDLKLEVLNNLFQGGKSWDEVFGWMTAEFFNTWKPTQKDVIPDQLNRFFLNGQMNWLTPERFHLLSGGRWDPIKLTWYTVDGREIRPSTQEWSIYFGDLNPVQLSLIFPQGGYWNDSFGWMTADFFKTWNVQIPVPVVTPEPKNVVPSYLQQFFAQGGMNWLTQERLSLLAGGRWDSKTWIYTTADGKQVRPGFYDWIRYFGDLQPTQLTQLLPNGGYWDQSFGWMTPSFFSNADMHGVPVNYVVVKYK